MHAAKHDLPIAYESDGIVLHEVEWGEMNVGLEAFPAGLDTAPIFRGLPDDRCQCPHWGYVVRGKMRVRYADHDEVLAAGDAYHLAPGHTIEMLEPSEIVEFSPRSLYQQTMEVAERNIAARQR